MHDKTRPPPYATLTEDWVFETKWDGFRVLAVAVPKQVALYSRNGNNISEKYCNLRRARQDRHEEVINSELVAVNERRPRFQLLQKIRPQFGIAALAAEIHETLKVPGRQNSRTSWRFLVGNERRRHEPVPVHHRGCSSPDSERQT